MGVSDETINAIAQELIDAQERGNADDVANISSRQAEQLSRDNMCRLKIEVQRIAMAEPDYKVETKIMPKIMEALEAAKPGTITCTYDPTAPALGTPKQ